MSLNPDLNKKFRKLCFWGKWQNILAQKICFKNVPVFYVNFKKHLGMDLDEKLDFNYHT